jgi:acetyl esterase/lipase
MALAAIGASVRRTPTAAAFHAAAVAAAIGCALLIDDARAAESARDWSRVELAWRDDPRVPADLPATGDGQQRSLSRRAARRAARRGRPLDGGPAVVGRPDVGGPGDGIALPASAAPPIAVDGTLGTTIAAPADGVLVHRDLPVGEAGDRWRRFDLYLPDACATGGLPLVVWIGGSDTWDGTRAACPLRWLVARGYAVACIGYRPQGTAVFPAQLDDCRAAIATLVRDADTWGVDPTRICVIGRGTGGHLAALTALAEPAAGAANNVSAACAIAAPADLTNLGPAHVRETSAASVLVGGPLIELREAALAASPLAHVSADDPPLLLVHGGRDTQVPADQAARLEAACRAAGVDCRLVRVEAAAHDVALEAGTVAGTAVQTFLDRVLGAKIGAADRDAAPPAVP